MSVNTPCNGELQFWSVMRSQMAELVKQTTRIANALERQANLQAGPQAPRVGDWVVWTDPETGKTTGGWRIVRTPEHQDGVYYIERLDGSGAEVHPYEIAACKPAQGGR